jgi:DNA-binding NarL/FixJ family response regulator
MGGEEAVKKLLEIDPAIKAIVSSGYSSDPIMAEYKDHGFRGVVAKPYTIKTLSEAVNKIISEQ